MRRAISEMALLAELNRGSGTTRLEAGANKGGS
jgi:hypothetical protein